MKASNKENVSPNIESDIICDRKRNLQKNVGQRLAAVQRGKSQEI